MPPICFPQVQRNAGTAKTRRPHLFEKITPAACLMISTKKIKKNTHTEGRKKSLVVKYILTDSFHFSIEETQGTLSIFGRRGCVPALINSGRAALSVELPPEPRCTITQGGHLRSVWVWSCARVMNSCFFSFVAHQHFYSAVNPPDPHCNFSPCCAIAVVYLCVVFPYLAVNGRALARV